MKRIGAVVFSLALWASIPALGQLPSEARLGNNFVISKYRDTPNGRVLDMLLLGNESTNLTRDLALVTPFEMISFRNGQTNLTAEAPQCHLDHVSNVAWDASHLKLYTPTTNVFVQGDGFFFTESNHVLFVSNNVETQVVRALLKSSLLSGKETNSLVRIYSDFCRFDYLSNHAEYAGKVHVIDPQMDVTSDFLSVQLGTNGAIETIRARENVVIVTTNKGRATGDMALYRIVDGSEITDLTGNAFWQNGNEQARAEHFNYDSARHVLSATNHVRVRWPILSQTESGTTPPGATNDRILYAEDAVMQLPPTNGPVESLVANGNVIIVNQADQSRSTGEHAVYSRADNLFQLTGSPLWWNDRVKVQGESLDADVTNKIYHARGNSRFEMAGSGANNQLIVITATNIDYETNLATFQNAVHATLSEAGLLRDTLDCDSLNVDLVSNEAVTAVARGNVRGKTAPDRLGNVKTITCAWLTAHRSPVTLLMKDLIATNDVVITQVGEADAPSDKLTAASVIAEFFATTNQIEKAVAEHDVVFEQIKADQTIHATSARADYSATNDQVVLTGSPIATTDRYIITDADHLVWQPHTNRFRAFGAYNIVPIKQKGVHPSS